jgi:hypothetical protein
MLNGCMRVVMCLLVPENHAAPVCLLCRNAKAEKRRAQSARRREQYAKKQAKEAEWRDK